MTSPLTRPLPPNHSTSLRAMVLASTGQDVRRCAHCAFCADMRMPDHDLSLESVVLLVVMNDDEVLTSKTVWSDSALEAARHACASSLNMEAVLLALRDEALRRGLIQPPASSLQPPTSNFQPPTSNIQPPISSTQRDT